MRLKCKDNRDLDEGWGRENASTEECLRGVVRGKTPVAFEQPVQRSECRKFNVLAINLKPGWSSSSPTDQSFIPALIERDHKPATPSHASSAMDVERAQHGHALAQNR